MDFTKAQQSAIDERGSSLIISAGAGSGKTAVLTERILSRICDENDDCNIDDFLIVTFTNAAAKELSDRIRKKLSARPRENTNSKKIIKNIALLPLAKISTINSFCYELVRQNFQSLGISASCRIADEAEMQVIRQKLMNETISEYFENRGDDKIFLAAYEIFSSSKSDKGFVDTLLDFDLKLRNLPDALSFINNVLDEYIQVYQSGEFFDTRIGNNLCENTRSEALKVTEKIDKLIEISLKYSDLADKYVPALECERDFARLVLASCDKGYDSVREVVLSAEKVSLKAVRNAENPFVKELVKDSKRELSDKFRNGLLDKFSCSSELLKLAAKDTHSIISKLYELVEIFEDKLNERKIELSILEFSDCEKYALKLLVESTNPFKVTSLAHKLRRKYKEVYIDEYQDVNPLQDMIFRSIAREDDCGSEYSRFMVGDIKQSIYGFRGASSDIFMNYRDNFSDLDENASTKRIFMQENFRCAESVIGLTNILFSKLMNEYFSDGDKLVFSRKEDNKVSAKASLLAFSYDKDTAENFSAVQLEAALICQKIREVVNNPIYVDSQGKMYDYSDIGILARSKSALKEYESVLSAFGIPVYSDVGESFYKKSEINLCICILNSIDNPERDIYLAGFMRSFAGGFSDDELAIIKHEFKKMSLYNSVISYSEKQCELGEKCKGFVDMLRQYRAYSRGKSAHKLLLKIFHDFDFTANCCHGKSVIESKNVSKNLMKLYNIARQFSGTSFHGVGAFIDYLTGSMENGEVKSEREVDSNCVRIMTIHASKGLEFPICFVSNLSKRYNKSDETSPIVYSENAGIATLLCDAEGLDCAETNSSLVSIKTPFTTFVSDEIDKVMRAEEVRIFYVALTRARDMLIMTGSFSKKIENAMTDAIVSNFSDCTSAGSYMSLLLNTLANDEALLPFYKAAENDYVPEKNEASEFLDCKYYTCEQMIEILHSLDDETVVETSDTESELEVDEYALGKLNELDKIQWDVRRFPAKITVSKLKTGLLDEEHLVYIGIQHENDSQEPVPMFIKGQQGVSGADRGTAMHMFMQFADYAACENDGCLAEAKRLAHMGFIDNMQLELLDIEKLNDFFKSRFYKSISSGIQVYREQRFNLEVDAFDASLPGDMLVQGVIDLFYKNEDGTYTVVDFKTDRVFGDDAEKILIDRHKTQLMYYKMAVEQMTGCEVSEVLIYSFSLMKEINVI